MNPYMSFLLQPLAEMLTSFTDSTIDDYTLWACVVETLTKSFTCDDGGKWTAFMVTFSD